MKRKHLFFGFIGILFLSLLVLIGKRINQKSMEEAHLETIPHFLFYDEDGKEVNQLDFENDYTKVLVYFNSTCSLCEEEFHAISKSIAEFKDTQFIFISTEKFEDIIDFASIHQLHDRKNVVFLQDRDFKFSTYFKYDVVPSTFVYNADGQILKAYKGFTPVKEIILTVNGDDRR